MSATTSTSPVTGAIAGELKKKRVLLVDTSRTKRDLRAEVMRRLGMEVDCAADIPEARAWWKADLYDLVLINVEKDGGHRDRFCEDIRSATPRQQLAFFIGKPEYLADAPGIEPQRPLHGHVMGRRTHRRWHEAHAPVGMEKAAVTDEPSIRIAPKFPAFAPVLSYLSVMVDPLPAALTVACVTPQGTIPL